MNTPIIRLRLNALEQSGSRSPLESCTRACRAFSSSIISAPLTKECLNCIMCQAGGLAKSFFFFYSFFSCICAPGEREKQLRSENVTRCCGGLKEKSIISSDQGSSSPSALRRLTSTTCPTGRRCLGTPAMHGGRWRGAFG